MSYNQIESPFAPDLTDLDPSDTLTDSQDVLNMEIQNNKARVANHRTRNLLASHRTTIQQAVEYIKRTKQVINALHEHIDLLNQKDRLQRDLLKHCLTQLENPKPRNQELIINAIKQHLGEKE